MPRPAWGMAVFLVAGGAPVVALAQSGSAPFPLSTSLPPDPNLVLSRMLPPEPSPPYGPTGIQLPVLGAPVNPTISIPPATPVRPAGNSQPAAPDLSTTPVLGNDYVPRRGASMGPPMTAGAGDASPATYQATTYQATTYQPPPANPEYGSPAQPYGNVPSTTDPNAFLRQRSIQVDQNYNQPAPSYSQTSPDPLKERQSDKFGGEFGEKLDQLLGKRNEWFKSDHAFDGFISPMSNPFLFEDPRSLTEVRPIFEIDKMPSNNPDLKGGNTFFFGTQLRVAITDRLSFVINKLGGESFNPDSGSPYPSDTGFAELWFGPKYTFIRSEATGSLLAGGLQFQVPVGSKGNYQDTGTLTLVPYVSYAQSILRDCTMGSVNGMAGAGYAISVNGERSDYFYLSGHVDWNVMNNNHWFPFLEANWFMYTTNGTYPADFEGLDMMNIGGHAAGDGLLSGALGTRYKFTENYQCGLAFDFPIAGPRQVLSYGFTLDFIFRY